MRICSTDLMVLCLELIILLPVGTIKNENGTSGKEYMIEIKDEWLESVKRQSEEFGLKHKKKSKGKNKRKKNSDSELNSPKYKPEKHGGSSGTESEGDVTIVSTIHLFEVDHMFKDSDAIQTFKNTFEGKVLNVERREYSKLRFISWLYDSPVPLGYKQWALTTRQKPKFEKTWPYYGMDIQEAWSMGMTGQGVKVAVVDSGVELDHSDLKRNIDRSISRSLADDDINNGDAKRLKFYPESDMYTSHGTKAAGLIASEFGNGVCSAGVAFNATLVSLKVFKIDERTITPVGFFFPDDHISQALEYKRNEIDIYSCSFGLANMFPASTNHIRVVLKEGAIQGRNGKGSIYVFSAGNRGYVYDCNTVSYTSSIYTITIASVGKGGTIPLYAMPCAIVLAATYGEYRTFDGYKKLNTTTLEGRCDKFSGTSASAALASGIIALMLQANKNLTWRDVQHIIVTSSSMERLKPHEKTKTNGRGLKYNPYFGFGLMNATAAVLLAGNWVTVPAQINYTAASNRSSRNIGFESVIHFPDCKRCSECIRYIEHVRVQTVYNIEEHMEKHLEITLKSPSGTRSVLLHAVRRQSEKGNIIERKWTFTSVQFWGENPYGNWTLRMAVRKTRYKLPFANLFRLVSASFTFYGTTKNPYTITSVPVDSTENDNVNGADCATVSNNFEVEDADESRITFQDGKHFFYSIYFGIFMSVILSILAACYMYNAIPRQN